jgi:hypothetical protein
MFYFRSKSYKVVIYLFNDYDDYILILNQINKLLFKLLTYAVIYY